MGAKRIYLEFKSNLQGVWTYITESNLFGFFLNRTVNHMKDANNRITKEDAEKSNGDILTMLTNAAEVWSIESFADTQLIDDLVNRFDFDISKEAKDSIIELRNIHE